MKHSILKQEAGRTVGVLSMRLFVMVLSLVLCSHVAHANAKLDPDNMRTDLNYRSGSFTSDKGVDVQYKGCGTYYKATDWNGFTNNDFQVISATVTPAYPYIEISFIGCDHDTWPTIDQTYSNGFLSNMKVKATINLWLFLTRVHMIS